MSLLFRRVLYSLLILTFLIVICISLIVRRYVNTPLPVVKPEIVYVKPGSSIDDFAKILYARHLLTHPKFFIWYAKVAKREKNLKSGEYLLAKGLTPKQLLIHVIMGKIYLRRFTIIEGWTLQHVLNSLNNNRHLAHTLKNITREDFAKKIGINAQNFEGMFFPDTYLFAAGVSDTVILKKAFKNMQTKLDRIWASRANDLQYHDPYTALIIASLVEKETANKQDKPKIAAVIIRRLEKKMLLQIDASVIYGLGQQYSGKLTYSDLKVDTPYNTYLHPGLPPTPIGMPSVSSLLAAVHPTKDTALYYVAKGDGSHVFSNNFREHLVAVNQYRIKQADLASKQFQYNFKIIHWFDHPELNLLTTQDNYLDGNLIWSLPSNSQNIYWNRIWKPK